MSEALTPAQLEDELEVLLDQITDHYGTAYGLGWSEWRGWSPGGSSPGHSNPTQRVVMSGPNKHVRNVARSTSKKLRRIMKELRAIDIQLTNAIDVTDKGVVHTPLDSIEERERAARETIKAHERKGAEDAQRRRQAREPASRYGEA